MNIFILDRNPIDAARYHCDSHVVKMIMESGQMLSAAHHVHDGRVAVNRVRGLLRLTHANHPCTIWVRTAMWHYQWTHQLMGGLLHQYTLRYGKLHAYEDLWEALRLQPFNLPMYTPSGLSMSVPPQCMPDPYKVESQGENDWDAVVTAYRNYYFFAKLHIAEWKYPAVEPAWYTQMLNEHTRESQ